MKTLSLTIVIALILVLTAPSASCQSDPPDFRDDFLGHFERSSRKVLSLAEVVPEELYSWSPGEGVMPIVQVYMHIARYNFYYLESSLGIAPPPGIDVEHLEEITEKERVRALLQRSIDHVRTSTRNMSESDLTNRTMLYGREVESWSVLFQLLAHMNEHVGQSVSYARMNGIVPPWSS